MISYEPRGYTEGVLTATVWEDGVYLKHVLVPAGAPPGALTRLLRAGLEHARERGYAFVQFYLADRHPLTPKLASLAHRFGAEPIDCDDAGVFYSTRRI